MLKLGTTDINKAYLGTTEIKKAYLGSTLVFDTTVGGSYLLDTYTGAAVAYSLRQLKTGVTAVVKVRRTAGSPATADFTAAEVTDGTLAAWVGVGNDGFADTWYDQSGNGIHLTQATTSNQRQIVTNGVVNLKNGKPAFTSAGKYFDGYSPSSTTVYSLFTVFSPPSTINATWSFIYQSANNRRMGGDQFGTDRAFVRAGSTYNPVFDGAFNALDGLQTLATHIRPSSTTANFFTNGAANAGNPITTGSGAAANSHQVGLEALDFQEVIEWSTDQSSNRTAIETEINAYYGVY